MWDESVTDRLGSVFISYRRSPARPEGNEEAVLVRDALRRAGLPTWRDLDNLAYEPTEDALVAAINDPSVSGAILLLTPEVASSPMVRRVEAVRIIRRYRTGDGFWVLPVLVGLEYAQADHVLGSPAGFQDFGYWNMKCVEGGTLGPDDAFDIAQAAVKLRLAAIREMDSVGPLSISVHAHCPPGASSSLTHDFSGDFDGREIAYGKYAVFERTLAAGAQNVLVKFPSPRLVGEGMAPLPLGALVGAVYSPRAGFKLAWSQFVEGEDRQSWSFDLDVTQIGLDARVVKGDPSSEDLALAIGLSADIEQAVGEALRSLGVECRAYLHCAPESGSYTPGRVLTPEEGIGFLLSAISKVRNLREDLDMARANLHLFLACPLAMAVLIGQKLNTFSNCHLYEHNPNVRPSYKLVHSFQPSGINLQAKRRVT